MRQLLILGSTISGQRSAASRNKSTAPSTMIQKGVQLAMQSRSSSTMAPSSKRSRSNTRSDTSAGYVTDVLSEFTLTRLFQRAEGTPLLMAKFKRHIAPHFESAHQQKYVSRFDVVQSTKLWQDSANRRRCQDLVGNAGRQVHRSLHQGIEGFMSNRWSISYGVYIDLKHKADTLNKLNEKDAGALLTSR